jgi:hypothetical protein
MLPMQATFCEPEGFDVSDPPPPADEKTPDCPMSDTPPGRSCSSPTIEVASPARGLMVPMLLGPMSLIPALRAAAASSFCSANPDSPASE